MNVLVRLKLSSLLAWIKAIRRMARDRRVRRAREEMMVARAKKRKRGRG